MFEGLQPLLLAALAVLAGGCVVIQQALNATLRADLGSAFWAAFVSYAAGAVTLLAILIVTREPWPMPAALTKGSLWSWTGGVFGTVYIVASIVLLPRFGAMTVITLLIAGQMLTSIIFDHFALFGLAQRPIDVHRAAGAILLIISIFLIRR